MMMTKEDVCLGPWRLCKCVSRAWSKDFKMLSWMRTHAPGVKDCNSKRRVVKKAPECDANGDADEVVRVKLDRTLAHFFTHTHFHSDGALL